jgi:hypothetical protein
MEKETVVKNTIYAFKKFLRDNKCWEQYKRSSKPINGNDHFGKWIEPISFKQLVTLCEPVELIQSTTYFCSWACDTNIWSPLSIKWAKYCLDNGLYYDFGKALTYVKTYISSRLVSDFLHDKKLFTFINNIK